VSGDVTSYTGRITSEHANKPKFVATIAACLQPLADQIAVLDAMAGKFDIDDAVGAQLDVIGEWVGVSRNVRTPLEGVYFSFDTEGLGFEQGVIWAPGEPTTGLIALPDDIYKLLLRAKIIANQWDGTIPGAYEAWDTLLAPYGFTILIQDNGNMTMTLALASSSINPTFQELFTGGYLDLRPATVLIDGYLYPSVDAAPFFGFDVENDVISGFDVGALASASPASVYRLTDEYGASLLTEAGIPISIT